MQFLSPWFFAAFAALAIPVVIHLLNLRKPQTLRFSTVAFFKVLQQSTIRRIKIKRWLLLVLRLLAVAFLVLALVRPYLPSGMGAVASGNQPRLYLILADNSLSMAQVDVNGPYLDQVKAFLRALVGSAGPRDQFILAPTNGEWTVTGRLDAGRFSEAVDALEPVAKGNYIGERFEALVEATMEPSEHAPVLFVVTDTQTSQLEPLASRDAVLRDGRDPVPVQVVRVGEQATGNVGITNVTILNRILGTERPVLVQTELTNFGTDPVENLFLTLETGGIQGGQYKVNLAPGEVSTHIFEVRPSQAGYIAGRVFLEGDRFTADDQRFFSIAIPSTLPMLYVSEPSAKPSELNSYLLPVLTAAQETSGRIRVDQARPAEMGDLSGYQAVILDGLRALPEAAARDLQSFVQEGRSLVVLPSELGDQSAYNRVLELFGAPTFAGIRGEYGSFQPVAKLGRLSRDHPVLEDLFELGDDEDIRVEVPDLYYYWLLDAGNSERSRVLFESNLSEPLVVEQPYGAGVVLLSALGADPGWSNLPARPLFAPLYYRMVLYAAARESRPATGVELGVGLDITERFTTQQITASLNGVDYRPEVRLTRSGANIRYPGQEWTPGVLDVNGGNEQMRLAVNLPASESNLGTVDAAQLESYFQGDTRFEQMLSLSENTEGDYEQFLSAAGMGREVWHIFLLLAILFFMAETFISRWFKAENV